MVEMMSENSNVESPVAPKPVRQRHSTAKRVMVALIAVIFALGAIAGGAYIITQDHGFGNGPRLKYAPWADLGEHYDLAKVKLLNDDIYHFNSYELSQGLLPFTGMRTPDEAFSAKVLGTGVWIRNYPKLKNRTKLCQVKMGDELLVTRNVGYMEGKYWYYVQGKSGKRAGYEGFICTDYVIEQSAYDLLQRSIAEGNSNVTFQSPKRILRSLSSILIRVGAKPESSNLSVQLLDKVIYGNHTVVAYQIRDLNVAENGSLLAFVQFEGEAESYVVLGIVPGNELNTVLYNDNGSFDIYYY